MKYDNFYNKFLITVIFAAIIIIGNSACINEGIDRVVQKFTVEKIYGRTDLKAGQTTEIELTQPFSLRKFRKNESSVKSENANLHLILSSADWRGAADENNQWKIYQRNCPANCEPLRVKLEMFDENGRDLITSVFSDRAYARESKEAENAEEDSLGFDSYNLTKSLIEPLDEGTSNNVASLKLTSNIDVSFDNIQSRYRIPM